jgi:hypothetical protein
VRKFSYQGSLEYFENGAGRVDTRLWTGSFGAELNNSDQISLSAQRDYERLVVPFTPAGSPVAVPVGDYTFDNLSAGYTFGAQRRVSGSLTASSGTYYNGRIQSVSFGIGGLSSAASRCYRSSRWSRGFRCLESLSRVARSRLGSIARGRTTAFRR